ncbi:hypothetical protein AR457_41300 [Streptomyces agglomeratus]|uniref:Uncharacterized protein n=1 Tax=Streptomyces agglomeratus TaxID=285458 RepID=A0A1E5NY03_9ACTN|nr:hypothetical protein [Streptomyces agglomeratus]OEJ21147.1 hypothetical protein AR457_41300 [Streptomyces agglomeratus]OEJ21200.1 hypothetical protein AS594_36775 [Streptomyces agglomeratus]OEJ36586.1 hypothetical protein BGK72_35955 [Streptomyces agglomeratus]OEJ56304.1 hypothetical protein BGM19_36830 [Streptomyces agglomeratus]
MNTKPACGPERDPDFFEEVDKLFAKHPEAADRYAVKCRRLELEILKIDFKKQVGVTRIEDGRIVTEFLDRDKVERDAGLARMCCEWPKSDDGSCSFICPI